MSEEFLLHAPPRAMRAALTQDPNEPYSEDAAIMSLMLDIDINDVKQKRDYESIWNWSEKKVRYHWERLFAEATKWLTWYGKKRDKSGATVGRRKGDGGATSDHVSPLSALDKGDGGATVGRRKGEHTIQYSELQNSEEEHSLPSVENEPPNDKLVKFDDWDMSAALACEQRLLAVGNLDDELTDTQRVKWADEFRKLRKIDRKDPKLITAVMLWLFETDDFWVATGNFCTVMKLRQKDKNGTQYFKRFEIAAASALGTRQPPRNGRRGYGSLEDELAKAMAERQL